MTFVQDGRLDVNCHKRNKTTMLKITIDIIHGYCSVYNIYEITAVV